MNPPSYGVPQHHQRRQFVDDQGLVYPTLPSPNPLDHAPSMTHHHQHQFWQHQPSSQSPFLPLQRQEGGGAGGEEHLVLATQHEPGPTASHQPFFAVNFKLGLNENSFTNIGVGEVAHHLVAGTNGMEGIPLPWHLQAGSTVPARKPFRVPLNSINSEQGTKIEGQRVPVEIMRDFCNKHLLGDHRHGENDLDLDDKCRLYGELDDIYGLMRMGELQPNQAGSMSELTGENSSANAGISVQIADTRPSQVFGDDNPGVAGVEHGSDNSVGKEALLAKKRGKRKRKLKETLSSMAGFFENFVKRVIDHQEALYKNFLVVVERMDAERKEAEKEWRCREAAKWEKEAIARAQEEALAMRREAQIVSYIEKISGQSMGLPHKQVTNRLHQDEIEDEPINKELEYAEAHSQSRWPIAEDEALIKPEVG